MLGSVNPNAGSSGNRPVEKLLPVDGVKAPTQKAEVSAPKAATQEDTVELSSVSQQYQAYRAALSNEPDVRPGAMEKIRAILSKDKNFPPLLVLQGMGKLLGNLGTRIQDDSNDE